MKRENLIIAAMGFVVFLTLIICVYKFSMKELDLKILEKSKPEEVYISADQPHKRKVW